MIDSGNTLNTGVAISDKLRKKMGLRYDNLRKRTVGTANQKGKLIQLGETEEITIRLDGTGAVWTGKACVFQELADEMNIGTAALISMGKKKGKSPYLAFTPVGTKMGWLTPRKETYEDKALIKEIREPEMVSGDTVVRKNRARETSIGSCGDRPILASQDTILKRNSLNFLEVKELPKESLVEEPQRRPTQAMKSLLQSTTKDREKLPY